MIHSDFSALVLKTFNLEISAKLSALVNVIKSIYTEIHASTARAYQIALSDINESEVAILDNLCKELLVKQLSS